MGVRIDRMNATYEFSEDGMFPEQALQVLSLAKKVLQPFIEEGFPDDLSHLVIATTCPDMLAPSLGQMINETFNEHFSDCHSIDIVQGCAGGVTAMILGSQLCHLNRSSVLVIQADAANKATSKSKKISRIFGNGAFACLLRYDEDGRQLLHSMSRQYKGLSEVVTVKLGHDADTIIQRELKDMKTDPRKHLGLSMNNALALKLFSHAEAFYLEFVRQSETPDVMILHQVNPMIMRHLQSIFSKYPMEFIDVSAMTGNCGAASVGIALDKVKDRIAGKKTLLCSFGTGGVITAGLWQN